MLSAVVRHTICFFNSWGVYFTLYVWFQSNTLHTDINHWRKFTMWTISKLKVQKYTRLKCWKSSNTRLCFKLLYVT